MNDFDRELEVALYILVRGVAFHVSVEDDNKYVYKYYPLLYIYGDICP